MAVGRKIIISPGIVYSSVLALIYLVSMIAGTIQIWFLLTWTTIRPQLMYLVPFLPNPPTSLSANEETRYIVALSFHWLSCAFFLLTVVRALIEPKFAAGKPDYKKFWPLGISFLCKIVSSSILFLFVKTFSPRDEIYTILNAATTNLFLFLEFCKNDDSPLYKESYFYKPWILQPLSLGLKPIPNTLGPGFSSNSFKKEENEMPMWASSFFFRIVTRVSEVTEFLSLKMKIDNPNDGSTRVLEKQICGYVFACITMIYSGLGVIGNIISVITNEKFVSFSLTMLLSKSLCLYFFYCLVFIPEYAAGKPDIKKFWPLVVAIIVESICKYLDPRSIIEVNGKKIEISFIYYVLGSFLSIIIAYFMYMQGDDSGSCCLYFKPWVYKRIPIVYANYGYPPPQGYPQAYPQNVYPQAQGYPQQSALEKGYPQQSALAQGYPHYSPQK